MGKCKCNWWCVGVAGMSFLLMSACERRPDMVLSDDKTADLLADLHIADAYGSIEGNKTADVSESVGDSAMRVLRQSVMLRHGVKEEEFDSTLSWYGHHLDKYEDMYELVMERLASKQRAYMEADRQSESAGAGLWPYGSMLRLEGTRDVAATLTFKIDGAVPKGGKLIWEAKTFNAKAPVEVFLAADYTNGSIGYVSRTLMGDGTQRVTLQTDSSLTVRSSYGYIRSRQEGPLLLDSISLVAAPLNQTSYYEYYSAKRYSPAGR